MTRKETIRKFVAAVRQRRLVIKQLIEGAFESLATNENCDLDELAALSEQREVYARLAESGARELEQIDAALLRHKRRKYGVCENCKRDIPLARLRTLPYTTQCVRCKLELESPSPNHWIPHSELQNETLVGNVLV